jgi:hypothetical protein
MARMGSARCVATSQTSSPGESLLAPTSSRPSVLHASEVTRAPLLLKGKKVGCGPPSAGASPLPGAAAPPAHRHTPPLQPTASMPACTGRQASEETCARVLAGAALGYGSRKTGTISGGRGWGVGGLGGGLRGGRLGAPSHLVRAAGGGTWPVFLRLLPPTCRCCGACRLRWGFSSTAGPLALAAR